VVRIRLRRIGLKRQPSYRLIVANSEAPRDGRFLENIGFYNPRTKPETVDVNEERALYWLSVGAQPSESVVRLLTKQGTLAHFERLKAGEAKETLLAEVAQAAEGAVAINPKTSLSDIVGMPGKIAKRKAQQEAKSATEQPAA
jgi:small subunit ribosomal protein S16